MIEPMHRAIRHEVARAPGVLLAIHDWSTLSFGGHASKADRATLTHAHDVGYDLATVLVVRGDDGAPVAPAEVALRTADAVLSTRPDAPTDHVPHVDQVLPAMRSVRDRDFGAAVVHVIDREADSVGHWRQWSADGHHAVVRGDDRKVLDGGRESTLMAVARRLDQAAAFREAGPARYRGRVARLFVAEADVVLHRPGKRHVGDATKKRQVDVPGEPLPLRLVVAEVRDPGGRLLARWLLLTNVPAASADAATIARWYYYRWRIESLHKLLKGAGWQLEGWRQRDGERLLKRLLLAFGACASIWALGRRDDRESQAFQELLMQLSGRQAKRRRRITTSGLLAGLWVLQGALGPLARHGPDQLDAMLENHLPLFAMSK